MPCFLSCFEQISDKNLVDLIRRKCHLAQPYAGAFLKKEDRYVACTPVHHGLGIMPPVSLCYCLSLPHHHSL